MAPNETMSPRARVSLALSHREPDRISIDLRSFQTGIYRIVHQDLLAYPGLKAVVYGHDQESSLFLQE